MKNKLLLDLFIHSSQTFISGEEISKRLKISRTAVWKQINQLRDMGYEFEAVSRKGYRMTFIPDFYIEADIDVNLNTKILGRKIHIMDSTASTQVDAMTQAENGTEEGSLFIAEQQTSGRGRLGRKWFSPSGKGIWMSLVLRPELPIRYMPQLTLLTGVAVCKAIRRVTGAEAAIKWPNDILIHGKKVCGILLESATEDNKVKYCIAGIGIDVNLSAEDYPEELTEIATSLKLETGHTINRALLIAEILNEMELLYDRYTNEGFNPIQVEWEEHSVSIGQAVRTETLTETIQGVAKRLDPSGGLVIAAPSGEERVVYSGEVEIIKQQ
ncbi:biotin--[acetyl-CoA-carboxylase] ligase [Paenibacillus urinalis]|uniref:Bifunctional ligase/repressor BirA n=1 Tax=Paenibacillus urinalis TaxID=521520 RepID=A0ABY7X4Z6_9BACL|nr:biotin--[acetyl-CoA-carboxylase] ligase [Paenibacillus urinalis]WDH97256.1 biotin--[acetyl-CoA-carboxylase] ligase [Paenibacillus urinalis]WDI00919.1 biotin--[acetyl-CoA-carboxylase] ligase [Paenibacillus urinalis]